MHMHMHMYMHMYVLFEEGGHERAQRGYQDVVRSLSKRLYEQFDC